MISNEKGGKKLECSMVVPMTRVIGVKYKSENEEDNRLHDYDTQYTHNVYCL